MNEKKKPRLQTVKGYFALWWDCPSCTASNEEDAPPGDVYGKEIKCVYCGEKFHMEEKP